MSSCNSTAQHSTVQHNTAEHIPAQHSTVQHSLARYVHPFQAYDAVPVHRGSPLQLRYQASYWRQLAVLSRRLAKATWVDPMLLAMNWGAALLMALGLGIVYWHATRDTG